MAGPELDAEKQRRYRSLGIDVNNPDPDGSDYRLMNLIDHEVEAEAKRVQASGLNYSALLTSWGGAPREQADAVFSGIGDPTASVKAAK